MGSCLLLFCFSAPQIYLLLSHVTLFCSPRSCELRASVSGHRHVEYRSHHLHFVSNWDEGGKLGWGQGWEVQLDCGAIVQDNDGADKSSLCSILVNSWSYFTPIWERHFNSVYGFSWAGTSSLQLACPWGKTTCVFHGKPSNGGNKY